MGDTEQLRSLLLFVIQNSDDAVNVLSERMPMSTVSEFKEQVLKAERNIKRRLPIGSKTNVSKLVSEMSKRSLTESVINRVLNIMHSRGEIEYRARRRQVYRLK